MGAVIHARDVRKRYGRSTLALDGLDFNVAAGRIVGLMGPNGAGKTTALKAILGLTPFEGELQVLGRDPRTERDSLMKDVCFIADVAVLPKWLRVDYALDYVAGVHPKFDRQRADEVLMRTDIKRKSKVGELSKGMITQLHLALIMAIDAKLLVLDEPTLGLDLLYRRSFYEALLNDYFDHERTILVTTHQVEEVENLLTDVLFISHGKIVLDSTVDALSSHFAQLVTTSEHVAAVRALRPVYEREVFGRYAFVFDIGKGGAPTTDELAAWGDVRTPSIADLFVALMNGGQSNGATATRISAEVAR